MKIFIWVLVAVIIVAIGWYVFILRPVSGPTLPSVAPAPQGTASLPTSTAQPATVQGSAEASSGVNAVSSTRPANTSSGSNTGSSTSTNNPTGAMNPFQNAYTNPF